MELPMIAYNAFTETENKFTARRSKRAKKTLTDLLPSVPTQEEIDKEVAYMRRKIDAKETIQAAIVRRFNLWQRSLSWYVPAVDRVQALADYIELCDAIDKADDTFFRMYGERVDNDFQMQTEGKVC